MRDLRMKSTRTAWHLLAIFHREKRNIRSTYVIHVQLAGRQTTKNTANFDPLFPSILFPPRIAYQMNFVVSLFSRFPFYFCLLIIPTELSRIPCVGNNYRALIIWEPLLKISINLVSRYIPCSDVNFRSRPKFRPDVILLWSHRVAEVLETINSTKRFIQLDQCWWNFFLE